MLDKFAELYPFSETPAIVIIDPSSGAVVEQMAGFACTCAALRLAALFPRRAPNTQSDTDR